MGRAADGGQPPEQATENISRDASRGELDVDPVLLEPDVYPTEFALIEADAA